MQVDRREPVTLTLERCSNLLKGLALLGELEGSFYDWHVCVGRRHRSLSNYAIAKRPWPRKAPMARAALHRATPMQRGKSTPLF